MYFGSRPWALNAWGEVPTPSLSWAVTLSRFLPSVPQMPLYKRGELMVPISSVYVKCLSGVGSPVALVALRLEAGE